MKTYLLQWLILLSLSIVSIDGYGNEVTEKQTSDNAHLEISQQLKVLENRLLALEQSLADKRQARQVPQLLAKMPVSQENFIIRQTAFSNVAEVTQTLVQAKALQEQFDEAKNWLVTESMQLERLNAESTELIEALQSIKQLLDNPVNRDSISEQHHTLPPNHLTNLVTKATAIQTAYVQWEKTLDADTTALNSANVLLTEWINSQKKWLAKQQKNSADNEKNRLTTEKNNYEKQADNLQQQLYSQQGILRTVEQLALQQQIDEAYIQAWLTDVDIRLLDIMKHGQEIQQILDRESSLKIVEIETVSEQLGNTMKQLKALHNNVKDRYATFKKRTKITGIQADIDEQFTEYMKLIAYQQLKFEGFPKKVRQLLSDKKQINLLSNRTWFNTETFGKAHEHWSESFVQIAYQLKISAETFFRTVTKTPLFSGILAMGSLLLIWLSLRVMRLLEYNNNAENTYDKGILATLKKITTALGVLRYLMAGALFILILVRFSAVPSPSDDIIRVVIYTLVAVVIGWELLAKEANMQVLNALLRYQGSLALILLGIFVLLYGLSSLSEVDEKITLLYEKGLMLSMIITAVIAYRIILRYLPKQAKSQTNKSPQLSRQLLMAILWTVIALCALNLVGYGRLSWLLLGYIGMMALFLIVVAIGFATINQLRKRAKMFSIRKLSHGVFIAQDIVSPLSLIMKLAWLYFSSKLLFELLGWNSNSYLIAQLLVWIQSPLLSFGEMVVTLQTMIFAIIAIYLIFRIARWLKRFSYHWLFAKISDLGVRNSLSIFSQYLLVLAGVLTTLKILGIDLTSFAVFAGALGVGIGLGLQDIAKNFISGILLLIERPLRSGDWVVLDGGEGYVKSIGMRAITIKTFDNQEVIIPNGNAINNSFTNYTHSSSVTRTIIYVGAAYDCEPRKVLMVLKKVVSNIKEILTDPAPKVVMWEYADSSINYRVQYHIDLDKSDLLGTKNEILSAIWYAFQANDIEIPFPQRDINFRNTLPMRQVEDED